MDEQKSNCEENDSEPTADDNAPSKQLVPSEEESKALLAAEDVSGATAALSCKPVESVQACALCNCVERSLHGQRELRHFGPFSERPTLKPSASPLPQPGNDDLSFIGFSDSPYLTSLFDDSGGCAVHHWCAVWSEGVKRMENEELENVDKAVISGTQRLCEYCKRLGATIQCHAEGCTRFYHFPCSAASGSFQSMKQLVLLCPEHIDKAEELAGEESWCAVCDSAGELTDLLFCTGCGQHYHAACLEIGATPIQRAGWQCPECKVCQTCRQPGEDSKMLVCDACDKGYHTFCLQPAMDSLPSDPWKCRRCRVCTECGVRGLVLPGLAQWFDNYAVCEGCQRHRSCGVCSKAANSSVTLLCCSMCHRWVHSECALPGELSEAKCICRLCKEDEQQPVAPPHTAEIQTREASEETEGRGNLVEMTIQTDADMVAEEHTDLPEVTPGQKDASETVQAEATTEKEAPMGSGVESAVVETTDGEKIKEDELQVATEGSTSKATVVPLGPTECATKEQGASCLPADEERAEEEVSQVTEANQSQDATAETQCDDLGAEPTPSSHQGPESMEVEVEKETQTQEVTPSADQEASPELLNNGSECTPILDALSNDPPKLPASPASLDQAEHLPVDNRQERSPCQDPQSPSSLSVDTQEVSSMEIGARLLPHSEEEDDEEEYDEHMRGDGLHVDIKQELQEQEVKRELLLDEMSYLSPGDGSSSGFLGSPGEHDPQLSMEFGLLPAGHSHTDNVHSETDDSLPFEPFSGDREKVKRRGSPGRSRVKQGRSNSFPGKRRPRGGGGGRGRGGRSRLKAMASCIDAFLLSMTTDTGINKEEDDEEDDTMQNTVVLFSNTDKFVLLQDMCVVCGSFGKGAEGQLLACAQCAQCYHPYCVNSKITKTMLRKGWRCLECIVCEMCGKASDPSRLLLCDDCDVSYHTYCLDPPLHNVPKGGWKCKWCVCCVQCGSNSPGFHCEWQNNYTHCGPCASLVTCPVCRENFMEEELLLQCQYCDRWVHAVCESLYTEDEVEQASDEGFACTSCSAYVPKPVAVESAIMASIKIKEPEPQFYRLEGVWLTESGMSLLRSISMSPLHKRRQRRSRLGTLCCEGGPDGMDLREVEDGEDGKGCGEPMECESKMENPGSPDGGAEGGTEGMADCEGLKGEMGEMDDSKKRKRKPYRPGIGGFMVRQRKCHTRLKKEFFAQLAGETTLDGQPIERTIDEAEDRVVTFPLKQEGGDASQAQGDGAGVSAPSSTLKDQASSDPHDSDAEKREGLPQGMESQDSEQFFRKVLGVSEGSSLGGMKPILEGSKGELDCSALPQRALLSGSLPSAGMMDAFPGLTQSPFFDMRDRGGLFSPDGGEESPWATPSTPATPSSPSTLTEAEGDGLSYNQRSLQRWEKDEELAELSTISPVLYANTNFPTLKQDYPAYMYQKAKDNRAAQRINKAQKVTTAAASFGCLVNAPHQPALSGTQEMTDISAVLDPALVGLSPSELEKHRQRLRLREFLIRQQMQRNSIRLEKEAAAAAAAAAAACNTPPGWSGGEMGAFQQDKAHRAPPPYPQDRVAATTAGPQTSAAGKMTMAGSMADTLIRPPPTGTPGIMDPSALRPPGPSRPQGMFARPPFPPQWQGQPLGPRRFPQPGMEAMGIRHNLNPAANLQGMDGMGNPHTMMPGHGGETMQPMGQGPPPQFIELRHNAQRLSLRPQFMPRGPQPRPRLFLPQQEMAAPYVQQHPIAQAGGLQTEGGSNSQLGLPQGGLSLLLPQQSTGLLTQQPHVQPQATTSTPHVPSTEQHQLRQPGLIAHPQPATAEHSEELPEPDLEGLGDAPGDGGVEDEDDLALDLDPDKGDDDLGNLDNLETNDPHLDDLLNSDEFDLLAYTDPELDQGDPKDVFSDQLRLVEAESEAPSSSSGSVLVKVEGKGKLEPGQKSLAPANARGSAAHLPPSADTVDTSKQQQQQQQRLMGPGMAPHMNMAQQQAMVRMGQPGIHAGVGHQPQSQPLNKPPLANNFFPDKDLDKFATDDIMDPIAKAKMVALKGIKRVLAQDPMAVPSGINRQQVSLLAQRLASAPGTDPGQLATGPPKEGEASDSTQSRPNPPQFVQGIINDAEQHQYEEWLLHTQQLLQMQLKFLEEQIGVHRKSRKALCAKQRTAKKAGREFAEADAEKLKLVTEEQSKIQKQLDQVRKQQKEHTNLIAEYRSKQQQHQQSSGILPPGHSAQGASPHMFPKMPGQMMMGQQGTPVMAQHPVAMPQSGMPVRMPQGQPFIGGAQPQLPAALAARAPGPPGAAPGFFPQGPGMQGADPRLLQERQLQHRMQMAKLQQQQQQQQQQVMMGQQPMPHPNQQSGLIAQPPSGMMGNPLMAQQQANTQQGILVNQPNQQSMVQVPQGMVGGQSVAPLSQNLAGGQPINHGQAMLAVQPGIMGNPPVAPSQQQRPQLMMSQQGMAMMGMMRAQQQGMMPQRPAAPPGQIRTPINIQAIIAQNPQLRNLPPNQQIQHIQAMIAQRQLQQGQMLRMSMGQGQQSQLRPHMPPGQMPQAVQQMPYGAMGKPGAVGAQQQSGMLGQPPGVPPQMQQGMMVPGQQQPQVGEMMQQHMMRGQAPVPPSPMDQGRMDLQSITKRAPAQKPKRTNKAPGDRGPNARKKNKKDDVGKSAEALMKQLKQGLSLLPLMEPSITASLDLFAPFGSSPANGKAQLKGSFGNAVLDNIPDYYSQLLTKSNLSNPPTPPSSLPPTPPPSVQHKLLNGVTPGEELSEGQKDTEPAEEPMDSVKDEVKSVDILAALPTPPHNQNEDIRMESDDEDAPESIIPASSPESNVGDEMPRFPQLREPKEEETERAISPIIPLIPRTAIPAFPENKPFEAADSKVVSTANHWDKAKNNEVSVTFTLSSAAAKKLNHVMMAMAQLLSIRMPGSYEVTFPPQSLDMPVVDGPGKGPDQSGALCTKDGASPSQDDWLRQFDVSLPGCTLKKQVDILALIKQEFQENEDKPALHCYTTKVNDLDVRHLPAILVEESPPPSPAPPCPPPSLSVPTSEAEPSKKSASPSPPPSSPPVVRIKTEREQDDGPAVDAAPPADVTESDVAAPESLADSETASAAPDPSVPSDPTEVFLSPVIKEEDLGAESAPPPRDSPNHMESSPKAIKQRRPLSPDEEVVHPKVKKWKGIRWKRLQIVITIRKGGSKKESSREVSELMDRLRIALRPDRLPRDKRKCCFCHEEGDGATDGPARLLNIDVDLWVHLNCALWSTEVYETQGGALINVEVALRRGLRTLCAYCQKTGATNSCNRIRCPNVYHFACASRARCMFFKDKTMLCTQHKLKGPSEDELDMFAVLRRVYIERDEVKQIASILQRGDRIYLFRVGGLIFHAVGQLLPAQMANFHSPTAIFPVGYEATRIYWSTRVPNKRCRYRCRINEDDGRPLFEVRVLEQGMEDLQYRDATPEGIWERVVQEVAKLRDDSSMLKLFTEHVKGEEMYGLTVHAVMRITESLPGVENCQNYLFRYGRHPLMELPLMINPTGSARSEPKVPTQCKRPHTLNSTSVSKAYQSTFTGELNTPYSKQFVHSKSSQYRRLKTEWKNNVYLARSRIQGLGLYAAKDLEKHTMVIEYIGTNRGIYMFRINNEQVIDATLTGGPARYANHSCAPNCVAEVVTFDKEDKIIIISSRRIPKGEELTYDYQFDFEDDQHKIPCHCGAWNCRKWMN
ncbi:Histone-lysine N-methyltransferase 2D [Liparis tanakae]|uniref:[histone H3]-lysine(4) N-methyltransferase n=1 Tax=Liparis tanakae TaxID=230148 RepID=A0A4Z2IZ43_9TELE|nr:Histone-lysine N-methyltransferase 2D [Liparis tanakae]